jgi:hypothetical protein
LSLIVFLFWFSLSLFLLTYPPELDPSHRGQSGAKQSLGWRLAVSCVAGMVMSLLVMF